MRSYSKVVYILWIISLNAVSVFKEIILIILNIVPVKVFNCSITEFIIEFIKMLVVMLLCTMSVILSSEDQFRLSIFNACRLEQKPIHFFTCCWNHKARLSCIFIVPDISTCHRTEVSLRLRVIKMRDQKVECVPLLVIVEFSMTVVLVVLGFEVDKIEGCRQN